MQPGRAVPLAIDGSRMNPENDNQPRGRLPSSEAVDRFLMDDASPLRLWREHRGLSVEELAAAAGTDPESLRLHENGGVFPASEQLMGRLAEALQVRPADIQWSGEYDY